MCDIMKCGWLSIKGHNDGSGQRGMVLCPEMEMNVEGDQKYVRSDAN